MREDVLITNNLFSTNSTRKIATVIWIGVFAGSILAISPFRQIACAQTLDDALVIAYKNNPSLQAARAGLRANDEGISEEISNWRPDVSVSADAGFKQVENTALTGSTRDQTRQPKGFGLDVTQSLFRGGYFVPHDTAATIKAENTIT